MWSGRLPGHWYPGISSRDVAKDIFVTYIASSLGQRQRLAPQLAESFNSNTLAQHFSCQITFRAVLAFGELIQAFLEFIVKAEADMEYRYVDEVIDALRRAKAKSVWLLTGQATVS